MYGEKVKTKMHRKNIPDKVVPTWRAPVWTLKS